MTEVELKKIIIDIKKIMDDVILMKEKITSEINKWSSITHKYNNELVLYIKQLENKQNIEFEAIQQTLTEIKDRLVLYEIDPYFDENLN
jgi:hypothetical protein